MAHTLMSNKNNIIDKSILLLFTTEKAEFHTSDSCLEKSMVSHIEITHRAPDQILKVSSNALKQDRNLWMLGKELQTIYLTHIKYPDQVKLYTNSIETLRRYISDDAFQVLDSKLRLTQICV